MSGGQLRLAALLTTMALASALALPGCDDDEAVCRPEVPAGRIQGEVRCGDVDPEALVIATRIPEDGLLESTFETSLDEEGFYSLDVPAGRYTLTLVMNGWYRTSYDYAAGQLNYGQAAPDTIEIQPETSPRVIDFDLGSLTVEVDLWPGLDGEYGEVQIHPRTLPPSGQWRTHVYLGSAEIEYGRLSVTVAGILPDEYRVEVILGIRHYMCYCPYDGEHVWYPGTRDTTGAAWVPIAPDSTRELAIELPEQTARIEGWVSGAWQTLGTSEPTVALYTPDSTVILGDRIVDEEGRFGLDLHLPGPVKVRVCQGTVAQWMGGPQFADATTFELALGETLSGLHLEQCGIQFVGEVPEPAGTFVDIEFYDPQSLRRLATYESSWAPHFPKGVANLWPGEFLMRVTYDPAGTTVWPPQWYDQVLDPAQAQVITITSPGQIADLPLVLAPGGTVRGTVLTAPGVDEDYFIIVTPADEMYTWGYAYGFGPDNDYEVLGLPDGAYKIGAFLRETTNDWSWTEVPDVEMHWYPGASTWEDADVLTISGANEITGIELAGQ